MMSPSAVSRSLSAGADEKSFTSPAFSLVVYKVMRSFITNVKNRLSTFRPAKIWQQIFCLLVLCAVIPVVIIGNVLIYASHHAVKASVQRDHRELALRAAGEVNEFVQKPRELLLMAAVVIGVSHTDAWHQETAVVELALRYPMFKKIVSVGMDGVEIASSQLGSARSFWGRTPAFMAAVSDGSFLSPVRVKGGDTPVVTVAISVTRWGKAAGVLIADVDLRGMWDVVDNIQLGKTGYACVLDNSGTIISHPNKRVVLGGKGFSGLSDVDRVFSGKPGVRETVDKNGVESLLSFAPIKDTGWVLVISQHIDEAYVSSKSMMVRSWAFVIFSVLMALLASIFLARYMSRPINTLLEGTRRMTEKGFECLLPVRHHDELGQIFESFNAMAVQLKGQRQAEKLSLIGRAATAIVHELKNSLMLVDTYIQLLGARYRDRQFIQEFTRVVPRELDAWKGMLQNMADYARAPGFLFKDVDVNALVGDVVLLAKIRVEQSKVDFEVSYGKDIPLVSGNAEKLKQVVLNLLSNAMEAVPSCGKIRIATMRMPMNSDAPVLHAVIRMHNTGEAIADENISRIFEPFFSTKGGSLGLGLAISREIIDHHHGSIQVQSRKGEGTWFDVYLPIAKG